MSTMTTLEPWQPKAVERLVSRGCDEERARRIAASVEAQVRLSRDECYLLYHAIGLEELCDGEGK